MTKQRAGRLLCPALTLLVAAGFAAPPSEAEPALKTFEVAASRYKYEPSTLEVEEGDRVVLRLRSLDIAHGLVVKEFKAKIVIPKGGEVVTLEFVAAKPGTFKFVCSEYCGRGHKSMKGQLVVRPRVAAGGPGGTNQPSPCTEQSGKSPTTTATRRSSRAPCSRRAAT